MKARYLAGAMALAFFGTSAVAFAAGDDHTFGGAQSAPPGWMNAVADQKLQALDGSSLTLSASEGGISLVVTSPAGETQKNVYALMSDKLGTISDGPEGDHLVGFFRISDKSLNAQFADGHTETLSLNAGGGLSLTLASAANGATCQAWYPAGHVFSEADRRAALAAYADRLGLGEPGKTQHNAQACDTSTQAASTAEPHVAPPAHKPLTQRSAANSTGLVPVMVRTSVVHAVDGGATASALPIAAKAAAAGMVLPISAPQPSPMQVASAEPMQPGRGASDCLSVDNDGVNLGFRNQCDFTVTFAYCLQKAEDPAAACDAGSRPGNVAANSFVSLLPGTNIKAADAEHDFRWVGCTGGVGEVVAHLDHSDPPAGRCMRTTAS